MKIIYYSILLLSIVVCCANYLKKETISIRLNTVLLNYKTIYEKINTLNNEYKKKSEDNTNFIIADLENNIFHNLESKNQTNNDYILIQNENIEKAYKIIQNIKTENYYQKLLYYTDFNKEENNNIELNQEECKQIILLHNYLLQINKKYFSKLIFNRSNINFHEHLGIIQKTLNPLIDKFNTIYTNQELILKNIIQNNNTLDIKKIIYNFKKTLKEYQKKLEEGIKEDINVMYKNELILLKELNENLKMNQVRADKISAFNIAERYDLLKKK